MEDFITDKDIIKLLEEEMSNWDFHVMTGEEERLREFIAEVYKKLLEVIWIK